MHPAYWYPILSGALALVVVVLVQGGPWLARKVEQYEAEIERARRDAGDAA